VIHEISKAAGDVWQLLHQEEEEVSITQLKKSLQLKENVLYMALGWLAREDQLNFTTRGRSTKISIKRL